MSDKIMKKLAALEVKDVGHGGKDDARRADEQQQVTGFLTLVDQLQHEHFGERATRLQLRVEE